MNRPFYEVCRTGARTIRSICLRSKVLNPERALRDGPLILACSHISHLEPAIVACFVRRPIHFMARREYFSHRAAAAVFRLVGAFSVDRFGNSLPAVRRAARLVSSGEILGIFPEGGLTVGRDSVLRGAAAKGGVCTIAYAANAPVVPVVVLGTEKLTRVGPWLPARRGRVWLAFGDEVRPDRALPRRAARLEMSDRLVAEFGRTYRRLLEASGLRDDQVP